MICLAMSRMSAFALYPVMVLAYLSKCKATLNYLEKTPVSMFMIKGECRRSAGNNLGSILCILALNLIHISTIYNFR